MLGRVAASALFAVTISSLPAHAVERGWTATVAYWRWVDIVNPGSKIDRSCGIVEGGRLHAIGVDGERVLAEYRGSPRVGNSTCHEGTLFFLPASEFESMTAAYMQRLEDRRNQADIVERLLLEAGKR